MYLKRKIKFDKKKLNIEQIFGSVALPGKMLLLRIIINDIIDAYFMSG